MSVYSVTPGEKYGYRKSRQLGAPLQQVEVIAKAKPGLWKVKFLDGETAGLTDYVRTGTLAIEWCHAEAFLHDELRLAKVIDASEEQRGVASDETVVNAINAVLDATGDWDSCLSSYGDYVGVVDLEAAKRVLKRARLDSEPLNLDPFSFIDRHGVLNLTFEGCLKVAQAFARAEPDTVLTHIDADERDYMERYRDRPYMVQEHAKDKAANQLAREWTEAPESARRLNLEFDELRREACSAIEKLSSKYAQTDHHKTEEIQRLRALVLEATDALRKQGDDERADKLLLQLNRPSRPKR